MPKLEIQLFGTVRLVYDNEPVTGLEARRQQALLAWLVLHAGVPQSRTRVAHLFWPDATEEQAHGNLRKGLYDLRHTLPDASRFIRVDRTTAAWQPDAPYSLDVWDFQAAAAIDTEEDVARAVELYKGEFLPMCYDDWAMAERERLQRLFQRVLERGIALAEAGRDWVAAIGFAERLRQEEPMVEGIYRNLMRLYALAGDQAAALRTYRACVRILDRELGVEPDAATQDAYRLLLHPGASPARPVMPPLTGRRSEWEELLRTWEAARKDGGRVLLVTGEAGIGKTRLAEELAEWARRQGITVAYGRGHPSEGVLPYSVATALLRCLPLPALDAAPLREIARLLPEVLESYPELLPAGPLVESWQREQFFSALAAFALAHRPLLLFVNDLQWVDLDSLEWLHYLLRVSRSAPLLLVATIRSEEKPEALWPDLRAGGRLSEIDLGPLSLGEAKELAVRAAGRQVETAELERLVADSEGNPLFLIEIIRAGLSTAGALPTTIRSVLEARLAQLSDEAREVAALAATVGRSFSFSILTSASHREEEDVVRSVDELWRRRIVREQGEEVYAFSHDKLREVVYSSLSVARKRMLHRWIGEALEAESERDPAALARHLRLAGDLHGAFRYSLLAGEKAAALFAHEEARRYFQDALDLAQGMGDRQRERDAAEKLGELLFVAGHNDGALAVLDRLPESFQLAGDMEGAARVSALIAMANLYNGTPQKGRSRVEAVIEKLTEPVPSSGLGRLYLALAYVQYFTGHHKDAYDACLHASEIARHLGDLRLLAEAEERRGATLLFLLNPEQAYKVLDTASDLLERDGTLTVLCRALTNGGVAAWQIGMADESLNRFHRALELAERTGNSDQLVIVLTNLTTIAMVLGNWTEATQHVQRMKRIAADGHGLAATYALNMDGWLALWRGEWRRARETLTKALDLAAAAGYRQMVDYAQVQLATLDVLEGRPRSALERLDLPPEHRTVPGFGLLVPVLAHLAQGEDRRAVEIAGATTRRVLSWNQPDILVDTWRVYATALLAEGEMEQAEQILEQCIELARTIPYPYSEARALVQVASIRRRQRRSYEAKRLVADAVAIFERLGAEGDLAASRDLAEQSQI